jgi:hypothetical protein
LKIERHGKLLEIFSDISSGAGSRQRSLQGLLVFLPEWQLVGSHRGKLL